MNTEKELKIQYYSKIKSRKVDWLWYPYIPYGKITIIQGDPGEGKTSLALFLISLLSVGGVLPMEKDSIPIHNVIYQNKEDSKEDTIKPRLENYCADCEKICFVEEENISLSLKDVRLEEAIKRTNARVFILDPIQAYFGGGDMSRANDTRPIMDNLCKVAERTNCAIILVGHLNKNENGKALYRGLGSIDIAAAARSILLVSKPSEDEETQRKIVHVKSNLAPTGKALLFSLENNKLTKWKYAEYKEEPAETMLSLAEKALRNLVGASGIAVQDAYEYMAEKGFSKRTVERAKINIGVKSKKQGTRWLWFLEE